MPLGWPTILPGGHVQLGHAPLREDASSDRPGSAPCVLHINVGGATPCSCLKCSGTSRPGTRVSTFRLEACDASSWNTRGFLGSTATSQTFREQKESYLWRLAGEKTSFASRKMHGKDEFVQALQVLHTQFRMFCLFVLGNVLADRLFFHENLLPDHAIVTRVMTCQGRGPRCKQKMSQELTQNNPREARTHNLSGWWLRFRGHKCTRRPPERKKSENGVADEKKREIFAPSTLHGPFWPHFFLSWTPVRSGSHTSGPHPSGLVWMNVSLDEMDCGRL